MSEKQPPFPGRPEEYRKSVLMTIMSGDGVPMEVSRTLKKDGSSPKGYFDLGPKDGYTNVQVPLRVIQDLGQGDLERGGLEFAQKISQLSYRDVAPGDFDPLYTEVIFPMYGGPEGFVAAMEENRDEPPILE